MRLTVGGKPYSQMLTISMDPRVKTPPAAIAEAHAMAVSLFDAIAPDSAVVAQARVLRDQLRSARDRSASDQALAAAIAAVDDSVVAVAGQGAGGGRRGGGGGAGAAAGGRGAGASGPTFASIAGELQTLMSLLEDADAEPTTTATAAVRSALQGQATLVTRWNAIRTTAIPALNAKLRAAKQSEIALPK